MKNWLIKVVLSIAGVFTICIGGYLMLDAYISSDQIIAEATSDVSIGNTKNEFAAKYKHYYIKNEYSGKDESTNNMNIDNVFTAEATGWNENQLLRANTIYSVFKPMGFDDRLICGFIGNSLREGQVGQMEAVNSKSYWSAAGSSAKVLAGKVLTSMDQVDVLLTDIVPQDNKGIGVGMIQWSGSRRVTLLNLYKSMNCDFSIESLQLCEATMLKNEVSPGTSYYKSVVEYYNQHESGYQSDTDKVLLATGLVARKYEVCSGSTSSSNVNQSTYVANPNWDRSKEAITAWNALNK